MNISSDLAIIALRLLTGVSVLIIVGAAKETKMTTRTETKWQAKSYLMDALVCAANQADDDGASKEVIAEMDRQMRRIEKTFGYEQGSWGRWA